MNTAVCAVVVTYNRLEVLKKSLDCIERQTIHPACIIVVDNNSSDGTKQYLLQIHKTKNIQCLFLHKNSGYAGGLAEGIRFGLSQKKFTHFWMMDDDSYHADYTLNELVKSIEYSDFGIIGSSGFNMKFGIKKKLTAYSSLQQADIVLVDGALIKADVVEKIGVPDEKFFMMCEDFEYCKRINKYGYKIGLMKIENTSRLNLGGGGTFTKGTLWRGYYHSRNHMLIIKQYFSLPNLIGYLFTQAKFIIAAAMLAPDRFLRVKLRVLGMWHGIKGVEGKTLDPVTLDFQ